MSPNPTTSGASSNGGASREGVPNAAGGASATADGTSSGAGNSAPGMGGANNEAGSSGTGEQGTGAATTATSCNIDVSSLSVSTVIPTVGIVEWSTDLAGADSAIIEFGQDTTYGQTAPVDLAAPNFRTLLLGMKASHEYHCRVVVSAGNSVCTGEDMTLQTGDVPANLAAKVNLNVDTKLPDKAAKGFVLTSYLVSQGGPAVIVDTEGDPVWWYQSKGDDIFRARMSFDGTKMWMRNTANEGGMGHVSYVTMDGMEEKIWTDWPESTHDLAVLPDGKVGLIQRAPNGCDEIFELDPETGTTTSIVNLEIMAPATDCHYNALAFYAPDEAYIVSDYRSDMYLKISRQGEVIWTLNGVHSDFTGTSWTAQHNLHMLGKDHILLYSNGGFDGSQPTTLFEYQLDEAAGVATELWKFDGNPSNQVGGDVQRLHNGNTLATHCQAGVIMEISPEKEIVREITPGAGGQVIFGHTMFRQTLYGAPPRLYDFEDEADR